MKKYVCLAALLSLGATLCSASNEKEVVLKMIETSDVHGCYFPYDFIRQTPVKGGLAHVSTYVNQLRKEYGDHLILMDNGDILQGQPVAYYYNFIDTVSTHVCADMLNYMKYDVATMGNHDVETGHAVYDRWAKQCNAPVLGANIVDAATGEPYFPPYKVLERGGVKVAVLGMITPGIPSWLPENLWKGLRFEEMEQCAKKWTEIIRKRENPDILVGLFHSGPEGNKLNGIVENASADVARNVPGFDVVFMGHDHRRHCKKILNVAGDSVLIIDPANMAKVVSEVTFTLKMKKGKVVGKSVQGKLSDVTCVPADEAFMKHFAPQQEATSSFVSRKIGSISAPINARDAFFGPSGFVDLIHQMQLDLTGADLSFCAPLSPTAEIAKGDIYMSDMFNLYKFENMLYVMELTGKEIKGFLEMSYALWTNRMTSADDHLLLINDKPNNFGWFCNPSFNFDSAAGIRYTVDVTKPEGEKIEIECMADGTPFSLDKTYKVAVNSYRGNGGGDLLTKGAGIDKKELPSRIVFSTDKDLRYYLMKHIERVGELHPHALNQWKFIPEEWTVPAAKRDRETVFGGK